jgi:integrase/recombinase XerD
MELKDWFSPQMLARYSASAPSARARRTYDRILRDHWRPPAAPEQCEYR